MQNEEKITQAQNLYFNTTLTQGQIAELINVSRKTVSGYVTENNWKLLKKRACQMPAVYLEQMNCELQEINAHIAARPKGKRFPTLREAEVRRKILASMATIKERQSAGTHMAVLSNFMARIAAENIEHAQLFNSYLTHYILGEQSLSGDKAFNTYGLPGNTIVRDIDDPDADTVI